MGDFTRCNQGTCSTGTRLIFRLPPAKPARQLLRWIDFQSALARPVVGPFNQRMINNRPMVGFHPMASPSLLA
jgi:hypothetical protein